jgi:stage II sporulation protein D
MASTCATPRTARCRGRRTRIRGGPPFATAGRILTYHAAPAEVFYSASCGGRSERVSDVWPKANLPYLDKSIKDDVHRDDVPWTLEIGVDEVQRVLQRNGFEGTLKKIEVAGRTKSKRVARLRLSGMQPGEIAGDQFRTLLGPTQIRSLAFDMKKDGNGLRFTGRGYGHGVGMCVIGAGRRARRGDSVKDILKTYYPGLKIEAIRA